VNKKKQIEQLTAEPVSRSLAADLLKAAAGAFEGGTN
jgi:hypothetical protein